MPNKQGCTKQIWQMKTLEYQAAAENEKTEAMGMDMKSALDIQP